MVVRTIRARHSRKTGRVAITFEVDRETLANMRRSAQAGAHPDTLDYIAAVINTAFLEDAPPPGAVQGGEGKAPRVRTYGMCGIGVNPRKPRELRLLPE